MLKPKAKEKKIVIRLNLRTLAYAFWAISLAINFTPKHFKILHIIGPVFLLAFIVILWSSLVLDFRKAKQERAAFLKKLEKINSSLAQPTPRQPQNPYASLAPSQATLRALQAAQMNVTAYTNTVLGQAGQPKPDNEKAVEERLNKASREEMKKRINK